jgi:hypothetical protein
MSSLPPDVPPPPPPPPGAPPPSPYAPGAAAPAGLPWEMRPRVGFADALVDTIRLFVTNPADAWSRTREKGDLGQPLLFAVVVGWIGIAFNSVWNVIFGNAWLRFLPMLPPEVRERFPLARLGSGVGSTLVALVLAPLFVIIWLFIWSAILHLCFMIVGALSGSTAGFEGTFRVVGYSSVSQLAQVIPFLGGLVALVWNLVLVVMGAQRLHRTTQGKAIAGVVIPIVLCCGCVLLAIAFAGAAILAAFGGHR